MSNNQKSLSDLLQGLHMTFLPRHKAHFYDQGALQTSFSARPSLHTVAHPRECTQELLKLNILYLGTGLGLQSLHMAIQSLDLGIQRLDDLAFLNPVYAQGKFLMD